MDRHESCPKRSAAAAMAPLPTAVGRRKRRSGVVSAAALTQKIAALEAAVASGKAREAAQGRRTAELEADNARLSVEVTAFRNRPRLPTPSDGAQAAGRGRSASTSKFGGTACWSCIVLVCIVPVRG